MDLAHRQRVQKFISIVEKLKKSRFFLETKNIKFELNFEEGSNGKMLTGGYDEDLFRSMLLDLRKLLVKRDGVKIDEICDLVINSECSKEFSDNIRTCKEMYLDLVSSSPPIKMIIDGEEENAARMMSAWLYGHYIHEEEDKLADLARLGLSAPFHKFSFINTITSLVRLSIIIANNAQKCLGL